jgi:hypothetical protein
MAEDYKKANNLAKGFKNIWGDSLGRHNRNLERSNKRPKNINSVGSTLGNGVYGFMQPSKRLPSFVKGSSPKTVIGASKEGGVRVSSLVKTPKRSQRGMGRANQAALSVRSNPNLMEECSSDRKMKSLQKRIQGILQDKALRERMRRSGMTIEDDSVVTALIGQLEEMGVSLSHINDQLHRFGASVEL